ncbi:MAG: hypothetical protein ACYDC1_16470, partial [Limisphaerales bacterium]
LFVKGEVGVGAAQLDALAGWLDAQATNWVVVLLESAAGESFTDAEGSRFTGIEAVTHALGKGLLNQPAFGQSVHPRTGERNAAIFVLFLKDRRFSYFGSDAYDHRGLGEERWIGNLDQWAVKAMRDGGRVVDAVQDTITNLDRRLYMTIEAEAGERAQRLAQEQANRARAIEEARAEVESAAQGLALLEARVAEFNQRHPQHTGQIGRPDLPALRAELQLARQTLGSGNPSGARSTAGGLRTRVEARLRQLDQYPADGSRLEQAATRHQQLAQLPRADAARSPLAAAAAALELALGEYLRGDPAYVARLAAVEQGLDAAGNSIRAADRAAADLWKLAGAGGGIGLLLLAILGVAMNRRRLPLMMEAETLFTAWETGLREKNGALFELLDRRATVVGATAEEASRRYSGQTYTLARRIIESVDELFILSASAGRILQKAQGLLRPSSTGQRSMNLLSRRAYRRALSLLRDEPIDFQPRGALELVIRGSRSDRTRLVGKVSDYEPFQLSFNELIEAFNRHASRALADLDQVESAIRSVGDWAGEVTANLQRAREPEADLVAGSADDGWFAMDALFGELLPEANASYAIARKQAVTDPVGALEGSGATARQQASDAAALAETAREIRRDHVPRLLEAAQALSAQEVEVAWLRSATQNLSGSAEELAQRARRESVAEGIQSFRVEAAALVARAVEAVELDERRRGPATRIVAEAKAEVSAARAELGAGLGLAAERMLVEPDTNPDEFLGKADAQLVAARAALEIGDVDGAVGALTAVDNLCAAVRTVVTASQQAFTGHREDLARLESETARIAAEVPARREILAALQSGYAPSVLLLGAGDAGHPNANGTVEDNLMEVESHLAAARQTAATADDAYAAGRLLESARLREQIRGRHDLARYRLQEIDEKQRRVAEADQANASRWTALEERHTDAARQIALRTSMPATQSAFEAASVRFEGVRPKVGAAGADPFALAEELGAVEAALTEVLDRARCDRDLFGEAERSVRAAAAQLEAARTVLIEATNDELPDSPAIANSQRQLTGLTEEMSGLQARVQEAHGDWPAVDVEADRIAGEGAGLAATVHGELAQARAAAADLATAANAVRKAGGWTGGYGVTILGAPGGDALAEAREFLQRGAYGRTRTAAETARRMAEAAVVEAMAEMERRRQVEIARVERDRRRRASEEAARRSRGTSWSGGSSSSWGRSGSGFSTSGGGRSGSGFKTSGW